MTKSGLNTDALIKQFATASAQHGEQLRQAVSQATLGALRGREMSLQNIRGVLQKVTEAASTGAAQNPALKGMDVERLLDDAVAGMDDAMLKAVEANRVALQQFVDQGADLQEKHLKKALGDLEKFEDTLIDAVSKSAQGAGAPLTAAWGNVLEKLQAGGTASGAQASTTAEQFTAQMRSAIRDSREVGLKAAQVMAESYATLVSGVLIGMSDAMTQGRAPERKKGK